MTAGAVLLTILAPFIALVVALVMRGSETNSVKRAFLRTWAWASGAPLGNHLYRFPCVDGGSTVVRLP